MKEQKINWQLLLLLMSLVILPSCTKVDRTNPFDDNANLNPEEWAPKNFWVDETSPTGIKLIWDFGNFNIDGFEIERSFNGGSWESPFNKLDEGLRSFIDGTLTLEIGQTCEYRINACAGKNKSSKIICNTNNDIYDYDGNKYKTVKIGTQNWMAENLKETHYRNGEPIPNVTDQSQWSILSTGAYCWYNNNEPTYGNTYGALYNWFTVVDSRNLCPTGWHIASDAEWSTLTTYLGGESIAGGKMKETGTTHWQSPNTAATNESGFTGLPSGDRYYDGTFYGLGYDGHWWSSTESGANYAWRRYLFYSDGKVYTINASQGNGFSVRCVKD